MAYCDIDDIYALGVNEGQTYTKTTSPKLSQVEDAIDRVYADINSRLYAEADVSVPVNVITSPNAYTLLKTLNAYGAAGEGESIAYRENSSRTNSQVKKEESYYKTEYERLLKMYCDDPKYLIDPVRGSRSPHSRTEQSFLSNTIMDKFDYSVNDEKDSDYFKPFFRVDDDF